MLFATKNVYASIGRWASHLSVEAVEADLAVEGDFVPEADGLVLHLTLVYDGDAACLH